MTFNRNLIRASRRIFRLLGAHAYKPNRKDYVGEIHGAQKGNDLIREAIVSGKPFLAARLGSVELSVLQNYLETQQLKEANVLNRFVKQSRGYDPVWRDLVRHNIHFNAGFFPSTDAMLDRFSKDFLSDLKQVDFLGVWFNHYEHIIANNYCPNAQLTELTSLEPYYHAVPWSSMLMGKRVLVIHPFETSIRSQFAKRKLIFSDPEILPEFDLQTIKAVQTIAGSKSNFESWFDALQFMRDQISKSNFDIAIIGAGAYGLPLGSIIKQMNKQAIHMGGATQILFGIRGGRWDHIRTVASMYNDYWVRPQESERPPLFEKIENGCYW